MGLFTKSTKPADDLLERGMKGAATVEQAKMGGMVVSEYSGYMSQKKQEALLSGEKSMTQYKLHLQVQVPGRDVYAATITVPVPMAKIRYMAGGSVLPVLVDPDKPDRLAIDWDGEFQQGTLAEMADANPVIAAALRGAGVDVAKVSELQREQIAAAQTPGNVIIGGQLLGAGGAPAPDPLDQLKKLGELHDSGVITDSEFEAKKAELLAE